MRYLKYVLIWLLLAPVLVLASPRGTKKGCNGCCCASKFIASGEAKTAGPTPIITPSHTPTLTPTGAPEPTATPPEVPRVAHGCYVGDGSDSRSIFVGFQPDWVTVGFIDTDTTRDNQYRLVNFANDVSKSYAGGTVCNDCIRTFTTDGFTVGDNILTNFFSFNYCWAALEEKPGYFATGTYTGDGSDNKDTDFGGHLDFEPVVFFLVRNTITQPPGGPWVRTLGMGAGDVTIDWFGFASSDKRTANYIQAFNSPTGVQLGTAANTAAIVYDWWAFSAQDAWMSEITVPKTGTAGDNTGSSVDFNCGGSGEAAVVFSTDKGQLPFGAGRCNGWNIEEMTPLNFAMIRQGSTSVELCSGPLPNGWAWTADTFTTYNGFCGFNCNDSSVTPQYVWAVCEQ